VPPRAADAPWGIPVWLFRLGGFPEHKVEWVFFYVTHFYSRTGFELVEYFAGELAVAFKFTYTVIHVAIIRSVSEALFDQGFDQLNNVSDMGRRFWLCVGLFDAEHLGVFVHFGDKTLGECIKGFAIFVGALDNFIVDISDITDVIHVESAVAQVTRDHVERNHDTGMPQVTEIVDRHTTHVHADLAGYEWFEFFFLSGQGVKNL